MFVSVSNIITDLLQNLYQYDIWFFIVWDIIFWDIIFHMFSPRQIHSKYEFGEMLFWLKSVFREYYMLK